MGLPISANWKSDNYDSILVIIDQLTKIIHYEPVKVKINAPGLAEVIINVIVYHYKVPESIVMDQGLLFWSMFWFLLCYFFKIKKKLFTAFYLQTNGQTEK